MGGNTGMTPMSGDTSGILPTADNIVLHQLMKGETWMSGVTEQHPLEMLKKAADPRHNI